MTLNAVIAFILRIFADFDRFSGRLYHSG